MGIPVNRRSAGRTARSFPGITGGSSLTGGAFLSPDLSWDGKTILFSWTNAQENCWHIFKVNIDGSNLIQLTGGEDGEMFPGLTDSRKSDIDPCWLPNGRIVFISDRRGGFGHCHESNVKPMWTLYSMVNIVHNEVCHVSYTGSYPRPGLTQKTYSTGTGSFSSYRVYSLSGRCLGSLGGASQQKTIQPSFANGIYLIRPEKSTGKTSVSRILMQK